MSHYRYATYKIDITDNGEHKSLYVIVLNDTKTGLWVKLTDYGFLGMYSSRSSRLVYTNNRSRLNIICHFLNTVFFDDPELFGNVPSVLHIRRETAQLYLNHYAQNPTRNGSSPTLQYLRTVRDAISEFLEGLAVSRKFKMVYIQPGSLISYKYVPAGKSFRLRPCKEYALTIKFKKGPIGLKELIRDMPDQLTESFIGMAQLYDPELTFAIILMACMGLRLGEVCNMRRESSTLGSGIQYTEEKNRCTAFSIDLEHEYNLRSDGLSVGNIKTEGERKAHIDFADIVYSAYRNHISLMGNKPIESTAPMFINKRPKNGVYMAVTDSNLRARILALFTKHVLPGCKDSEDPALRRFYRRMTDRKNKHTWGPHGFRHWFTVQLVLRGVEAAGIADFRGDSSLESATTYIMNKGELQRNYKRVADRM